ncbi:hypothetical protein HK102_014143 [Quaeritorhiza haematococci]|nr:hypothetical protein HK102_014143 [Quaeritorhiza haematococci]
MALTDNPFRASTTDLGPMVRSFSGFPNAAANIGDSQDLLGIGEADDPDLGVALHVASNRTDTHPVVMATLCSMELMELLDGFVIGINDNSKAMKHSLRLHIGVGCEVAISSEAWKLFNIELTRRGLSKMQFHRPLRTENECVVLSEWDSRHNVLRYFSPQLNQFHFKPNILPTSLPFFEWSQYTNESLAYRIGKEGVTDIDSQVNELRRISSMFIRLPSFPIDDVKTILTTSQSVITSVIEILDKYKGTLRQFMFDDKGATVLMVWGLPPFVHESNQAFALKAALEIRDKLTIAFGSSFSIAVSTGAVFSGIIGNQIRSDHTVMGQAINTAARMMVHPLCAGTILVDEATSANSGGTFRFGERTEIPLKGHIEPCVVQVLISTDDDAVPRAVPFSGEADLDLNLHITGTAPLSSAASSQQQELVGRQKELKLIGRCIKNWVAGQRGLVFLTGPSGQGKSSVFREWQTLMSRLKVAIVCIGRANEVEQQHAYYVFRQVLKALLLGLQTQIDTLELQKLTQHSQTQLASPPNTNGLPKTNQLTCATMDTRSLDFGHPLRVTEDDCDSENMKNSDASLVDGEAAEEFSESSLGHLENLCVCCLRLLDEKLSYLPLFNPILGTQFPSKRFSCLKADSIQKSVMVFMARFLNKIQKVLNVPVAIGIDDAQWQDSASWELLMQILDHCPNTFIFVVSRPEAEYNPLLTRFYKDFEQQAKINKSFIDLQPMDLRGTVQMIMKYFAEFHMSNVQHNIIEKIQERSQGNPFVIEIICKALANSGTLVVNNGMLCLSDHAVADIDALIPFDQYAAVLAQFDKLSGGFQKLMKCASVLGQFFSLRDVMAIMANYDNKATTTSNASLLSVVSTSELYNTAEQCRKEDIFGFLLFREGESPSDPIVLGFRHIMIQQGIYGIMEPTQREKIHFAACSYFESLLNESNQLRIIPLLLYHLDRMPKYVGRRLKYLEQAIYCFYSNNLIPEAISAYEQWSKTLKERGINNSTRNRRASSFHHPHPDNPIDSENMTADALFEDPVHRGIIEKIAAEMYLPFSFEKAIEHAYKALFLLLNFKYPETRAGKLVMLIKENLKRDAWWKVLWYGIPQVTKPGKPSMEWTRAIFQLLDDMNYSSLVHGMPLDLALCSTITINTCLQHFAEFPQWTAISMCRYIRILVIFRLPFDRYRKTAEKLLTWVHERVDCNPEERARLGIAVAEFLPWVTKLSDFDLETTKAPLTQIESDGLIGTPYYFRMVLAHLAQCFTLGDHIEHFLQSHQMWQIASQIKSTWSFSIMASGNVLYALTFLGKDDNSIEPWSRSVQDTYKNRSAELDSYQTPFLLVPIFVCFVYTKLSISKLVSSLSLSHSSHSASTASPISEHLREKLVKVNPTLFNSSTAFVGNANPQMDTQEMLEYAREIAGLFQGGMVSKQDVITSLAACYGASMLGAICLVDMVVKGGVGLNHQKGVQPQQHLQQPQTQRVGKTGENQESSKDSELLTPIASASVEPVPPIVRAPKSSSSTPTPSIKLKSHSPQEYAALISLIRAINRHLRRWDPIHVHRVANKFLEGLTYMLKGKYQAMIDHYEGMLGEEYMAKVPMLRGIVHARIAVVRLVMMRWQQQQSAGVVVLKEKTTMEKSVEPHSVEDLTRRKPISFMPSASKRKVVPEIPSRTTIAGPSKPQQQGEQQPEYQLPLSILRHLDLAKKAFLQNEIYSELNMLRLHILVLTDGHYLLRWDS